MYRPLTLEVFNLLSGSSRIFISNNDQASLLAFYLHSNYFHNLPFFSFRFTPRWFYIRDNKEILRLTFNERQSWNVRWDYVLHSLESKVRKGYWKVPWACPQLLQKRLPTGLWESERSWLTIDELKESLTVRRKKTNHLELFQSISDQGLFFLP